MFLNFREQGIFRFTIAPKLIRLSRNFFDEEIA